ncbi:zinc finger protein 518B [Perognathus longimembris pacificus]|uniref:zinc finger protein 518B n=1 Tax=Perognathus longimembris pacificus TaxID=214514 RepID=UPI002018C21D|nr:zinc finger protein 518B [Perognathus longimembris pacificus]XP_048220272.1 zinc finger protein 518B [Perognathus longimembris pacificus]XP_048220273.1 zinc finger protein 518B [Perognathus longimembris pacificus]
MQIKKMKDIGEQLYTTPMNGGPSSLTMSPKQPNSNRATRPDRQEAQSLPYQGSEAEAAVMTLATCEQCKSVEKVPLQELKKGAGPGQKEDRYVCFKCSLHAAPPQFHFVGVDPGAAHVGNETETISSPVSNKFKVRNFKPGKFYCDKCRFSTKDPLQYKKHTLQHEEIKFICSHCSYISYTKGEFQRHLVKHTGIFPYRCEYCDYGAIRNDYIVKHRRRVHERAGAKRPLKAVAKLEPKRTGVAKQSPELFKAPGARTAFQHKLSSQLSKFSLHAGKDKTRNIVLLPDSKGYQKDVVCIPNKMTFPEPSELSLLGNKNVEVEVLSPSKELVQPGVPLTVVAPSELVVPTNCLAQLIDVKVVNGTQQLVLKLFPLEENTRLDAPRGEGGDPEPGTKDKGSGEQGQILPAENTKSPRLEGSPGELVSMEGLQSSVQKHLRGVKWLRSYDLLMPNASLDSYREPLLSSSSTRDLQNKPALHPYRPALPPAALKGPSPASVGKISAVCGPGAPSNPVPVPYVAALAFANGGRTLHGDSARALPLAASPAAASGSGEKGLGPRSQMSVPVQTLPSSRKPGDEQAEGRGEGRGEASRQPPTSSPRASEYLHINLTAEGKAGSPQPGHKPAEARNSERTNNTFDGPVISSVFSLSSGSENVPDSVKWNSATSKIKSIELLRKKIAQLIESCGKPSSLSASSAQRRSTGPAPRGTSKAVPPEGLQDVSVSLVGSDPATGPLQKPQHETPGTGPLQPVYPPLSTGSHGKSSGRVTRKAHVATPVLIPKGAVLRVLNSSEDAQIIEATCDTPVSIPCAAGPLPRPGPLRPGVQPDSGLQPVANGSELRNTSPSSETCFRAKSRKEDAVCSPTPKKITPAQGLQGGGDWRKQRRLLSRSLTVSRSKAKQVNASKKRSKLQAEPGRCLKEPSIFQVSRQLRLVAAKPDQLIKCPRRNQPVIVLNHPDVDSPEVTNVMKVINKYKGNVLKVVLSERTRCQLGIRRHHVRLTYQNMEEASQIRRQMMLKMKLKKVHRNNYQVVDSLPDDSSQCIFKCWFCGRLYEDQEEWMSHGQRHLIEATRDWEVLSSKGK